MAVNIYDVAKLSGVSIATVSRVVNGSTKVSEKTRRKVLDVMEQCGYTPNVFARGLGLDSMKTIGILCPDISDAFIAQAVAFLEERLHQYEYDCILGCSGYDLEAKEAHTKMLLSKRIDALILVSSTYAGREGHPEDVEYIKEAAKQTPDQALSEIQTHTGPPAYGFLLHSTASQVPCHMHSARFHAPFAQSAPLLSGF